MAPKKYRIEKKIIDHNRVLKIKEQRIMSKKIKEERKITYFFSNNYRNKGPPLTMTHLMEDLHSLTRST